MTNKRTFLPFLIFGFFSFFSYCMEDDNSNRDIKANNEKNSTSIHENLETKFEENEIAKRGAFSILPAEMLIYILDLLVKDACAKSAKECVNILSNTNLSNAKRVNKLWHQVLTIQMKKFFEDKFREIFELPNKKKDAIKILKLLLKVGASINIKDKQGKSLAILTAIMLEHKLEFFLKHIANYEHNTQLEMINVKDRSHRTVLFWAAAFNQKETIKLILNYISKLDLNSQLNIINAKNGKESSTVLIELATLLNKKGIKIFLNHINSFEEEVQLEILNAQDKDGNSALMHAIRKKDIPELILSYIEKFSLDIQYAIINAKNNNGNTALIKAAIKGGYKEYQETIEVILNHISIFRPEIQFEIINTKNNQETTAFDIAKSKEYLILMTLLRQAIDKLKEK